MRAYAKAIYRRIASALASMRGRHATRSRISRIKPKRILVLCYGNIYRSPFVERRLRSVLSSDYEIRSAGFHEKVGRSSAPEYIEICRKYDVDLDDHRSKCVDAGILAWADIIVIMDRHNWCRLMEQDARSLDKVAWIAGGETAGSVEIRDPYKMGADETAKTVIKLASASQHLASLIRQA